MPVNETIHLLEVALNILRNGGDITPAAWRLADAGLLLRLHLEHDLKHIEERRLCGLDEPTGRGAMLPSMGA